MMHKYSEHARQVN